MSEFIGRRLIQAALSSREQLGDRWMSSKEAAEAEVEADRDEKKLVQYMAVLENVAVRAGNLDFCDDEDPLRVALGELWALEEE